jgi:hypothetical protein
VGLGFADELATRLALDVPGTTAGVAGWSAEITVGGRVGDAVGAEEGIGITTRGRSTASIRCAAVRVRTYPMEYTVKIADELSATSRLVILPFRLIRSPVD